uniref:Uncharacterized protein n=1 Tax=Cucumis melo TaxID=3656 RepID=A0A9I9EJD3_CUCME
GPRCGEDSSVINVGRKEEETQSRRQGVRAFGSSADAKPATRDWVPILPQTKPPDVASSLPLLSQTPSRRRPILPRTRSRRRPILPRTPSPVFRRRQAQSSTEPDQPNLPTPDQPNHYFSLPQDQLKLGKRKKMAKKSEERLDFVEQKIREMRIELKKLPKMEENMSLILKSIENMNAQMKKQQTQQQVILKYIEGIIREKAVASTDLEGSPSKGIGSNVTAEVLAETTIDEYRNRFDKYLAPVAFLQMVVLEETFLNGLSPWLKNEVEVLEPQGLAQMTKLALKIENRERVRKECGLSSVYGSKFQYNLPKAKEGTETKAVAATASFATIHWSNEAIFTLIH